MSDRACAVTELLAAVNSGDEDALDVLVATIYDELRDLARRKMAGQSPGATVQATELVHEAYLRLASEGGDGWENRRHFFGAAARAMRNVLVDRARKRGRLKRGGDRHRTAFDEQLARLEADPVDTLALDEALGRLAAIDPRKSELVDLKFFAGLTNAETATALSVSIATVEREWSFAKAWLHRELSSDESPPSGAG